MRSRGDAHIGTEGHQVGDRGGQSICGLGKSIFDDQIFSLYPAEASQCVKQNKLELIKGLAAAIIYGKTTKPMAFSLRANIVAKRAALHCPL